VKLNRLWVAVAAVAALCVAPGAASASLNQWHPLVESGGNLISVVQAPSQPNDIYALSDTQFFASTDAGSTWKMRTVPCGDGKSLVVYPDAPLTVFAACSDGTVYRSDDGGSSWQAADAGVSGFGWATLAVAPGASHTLYAGLALPGVPNVFRSTDGGGTWTPVDSSYGPVSEIAIDPTDPSHLAAATWAGVILSTDSGVTWSSGYGSGGFEHVAFDPTDASTLWATRPDGDVAKSTDGGLTWTDLSAGPTNLHALAVGTGVVYAGGRGGVFRTTDGGASWQSDDLSPQVASAIAIDQGDPNHLFVGTQAYPASMGSVWGAEFQAGSSQPYTLMGTDPVTDLTPTSATLNGTIAALFPGDSGFYMFGWGLTSPSEHAIGFHSLTPASADQAVSQSLTGLTPDTTYHVALEGAVQFLQSTNSPTGNEVTFTTPPAVAPTLQAPPAVTFVRGGQVNGGQLPLALSWANQPGTYAIASAQAEASRTGGQWMSLAPSDLQGATTLVLPGKPAYRFRASLTDDHGLTGPWATTWALVPRLVGDRNSAITWSRGWTVHPDPAADGGTTHTATTRASMSFSFTGRSLAIVAPMGAHLAPLQATIDGQAAGTITPTATQTSNRQIVAVWTWPADAVHTLRLQARPTAAQPTAVLDALTVLR
jgi:photosystem II stability/assembly factor-like uncharacterized protein